MASLETQTPDIVNDLILRDLYAYWHAKCGHRPMPTRADIQPQEMTMLLPFVMIVDVHREEDGRHRHWFRLVGTKVAFGTDPTGSFLDDRVGDTAYGHHITGLYSHASRLERPIYSEYEYEHPVSHGVRFAKRLFLPLADEEGMVEKLLVGQVVEAPTYLEQSLWQIQPDMIHKRRLVEIAATG